MILRSSLKDPRKTSKDQQRDLATAGVNVESSTIKKDFFQQEEKPEAPERSSCYEKEAFCMGQKVPKMGNG